MRRLLKDSRLRAASGFTLIELLLVIVIIGILAGVLIAVIDPNAQQNRARDANVKATMNKVALAAQSFISAYGKAPNDAQLIATLSTNASSPNNSCAGNDDTCDFTITGNALGATCAAANGYNGSGTGQCLYRYVGTGTGGGSDFSIYAKSYGMVNTIFRYQNFGANAGQVLNCTDINNNPPTSCNP